MGWFEWLSDCDKKEGARRASVAEEIEIRRWRANHPPKPPVESDELEWEGCLLTGYHLHKVKKEKNDESTKSPRTRLSGYWVKIKD